MSEPLVSVRNLKKYFPVRGGLFSTVRAHVHAIDDVSFDVYQGETFGLVGESGCGKTTTGRVMLRLDDATSGDVLFEGKSIFKLGREELRRQRRDMQIIFQDPYSSLNPRMTVGEIVGEPLAVHHIASGRDKDEQVRELLETVGLSAYHIKRYPHEFSGGQRQRIGIARALALHPKLIVCDEPVSALDVSIQSQVLNLLNDLQERFGLTYVFIAHGLNVVKHMSTRIGVMYLGKLVEVSDSKDLFLRPQHPYTEALLSAIPVPDPNLNRQRIVLQGDVPSPVNPPSGCRFHTRCPYAQEICRAEEPPLIDLAPGHQVACHFRKSFDQQLLTRAI